LSKHSNVQFYLARNFIVLLLCCGGLCASSTGYIRGIVTDPSGANISGARVLAVNAASGQQRTAVTDLRGEFEFVQLVPGSWSLSTEVLRFKKATIPQVVVQVDQVTHADIALVLGDASEAIQISAALPLLESDRSTLSFVADNRAIANLPLNGRQYLDLALLTPGVVPPAPGTQGNGLNSAGTRSQSNVYLLDGVSNQDTQTNQPLNLFRITDAIEEFAVQTGVTLPEFGRGSGAQVDVVTKSGTNRLHGSAFEYARNTVLNAADFFTNKLGGTKDTLHRNQFGATLGGPVARDHTFFFVSYEGFRQIAPIVSSTLVPTGAQRATVTDPVSQRLLAYWPQANTVGSLNYIANVTSTNSDDTGLIRVDHRIGSRDQLAARWTEYWGNSTAPGPTPLTGGNRGPLSQVSSSLSDVHTFSPSFLNELRLGFSRNAEQRIVQDYGLDASSIFASANGASFGAVNAASDPRDSGLPMITVGGGFAVLGTNQNFPQGRATDTVELFDNMSRTASRHTFRWGYHVRREDLSRYLDRAGRGTISFQTFADFAKGMIMNSTFRTGSTQAYWRRYPFDAYWQDEFKARPNLTLHFGVRYEYPSSVSESRNHATNFVPGYGPIVVGANQLLSINPALVGPSSLVLSTAPFHLPSSGVYPDRNNLAPMLGFAYSPHFSSLAARDNTVIRGGFRVAYDDLFNNVPAAMSLGAPYNLQTTQTANVTQPAKFPWILAFNQNVPLISNIGKQGPGTPTVGILSFQGVDPNLRSAYAYLYNFGIERKLARSLTVEGDYQGSSGHNLGIYMDQNQPSVIVRDPTKRGTLAPNEQVFPYNQWGQSQIAKSIGRSNYNGLIATVKYRGRGTLAQASYTLGKSLDSNSSYFGSGNLPGETGAPIDNTNLRLEHGPSAFDVRQRLVLLYSIDLPFGARGFARDVLGGWKLSGITTIQTGTPFTVVTGGPDASGFNQTNPGISPDGGNRPNLAKSGPVPQDKRNPDAAFDPTWFTANLAGQDGTSGRNQYVGPGLQNFDIALAKVFFLRPKSDEAPCLEVRADVFNTFNHTNFANPIADMSNANFSKITQTLGSAVATSVGVSGGPVGGPRLIQISARLRF
jgi:hypothetical protein